MDHVQEPREPDQSSPLLPTQTQQSPTPLLIFYSHGRTPPLHPPADLKYDLRGLPNPPKAIRDSSDGRSKKLREHLFNDSKFVQKLKNVEEEVKKVMERKIKEWEEGSKQGGVVSEEDGEPDLDKDEAQDKEEEDGDDSENEEDSTTNNSPLTLRISCFCALGHHRSVAFVHTLAQSSSWPRDWEIQVVHRDVDKKRSSESGKRSREGQKGQFRRERQRKKGGMDCDVI